MRRLLAVTVAIAALGAAAALEGLTAHAQPYGGGVYGPGYGMMGGYGGEYGPGMMGGYGPGYGMMGGYGPSYGGYGPGYVMMGGYGPGYGRSMMRPGYGPRYGHDLKLSSDDVKNYLAQMIQNPNLKVGDVKEKDANTIVADVVTKDKDALVQRLEFNRHSGFYQPENQ